ANEVVLVADQEQQRRAGRRTHQVRLDARVVAPHACVGQDEPALAQPDLQKSVAGRGDGELREPLAAAQRVSQLVEAANVRVGHEAYNTRNGFRVGAEDYFGSRGSPSALTSGLTSGLPG